MPEIIDIIIGTFLAYYWTGADMVLFHSGQSPLHQPGYVHGGFFKKLMAGAFWPFTSKINQEFMWFFVCFLACTVVFSFAHSLLYPLVGSSGLAVLILGIARVLPIVSTVVSFPLSILAMLFWMILAKPFGAKEPSGMA
jgi:hypothetical protein